MAITLSKLPWYGQVGVFAALAAVGVGGFYMYYEKPARVEMAARTAQLTRLKADLAKGQETAKKLPEFKAEVDQLEARLANLRAVLPDEKDVADLLRQMQSVATQSNLTITSFKPAPIVTKELHAEWPITLELHGTYHNLALFLDRLGKFTRIINISNLDVKGREKGDQNETITATCVATTFVLVEKPAPDDKGGKPAAGKPAAKKA